MGNVALSWTEAAQTSSSDGMGDPSPTRAAMISLARRGEDAVQQRDDDRHQSRDHPVRPATAGQFNR